MFSQAVVSVGEPVRHLEDTVLSNRDLDRDSLAQQNSWSTPENTYKTNGIYHRAAPLFLIVSYLSFTFPFSVSFYLSSYFCLLLFSGPFLLFSLWLPISSLFAESHLSAENSI